MKTDEIDDSSAPLIEHLAELRNRIMWSVLAFVIGMILCFLVGKQILDFLLIPIERTMKALGNPNPVMQYTAPQEYFFTIVRISVVGGLTVAFPVIGYQMWRFVAPGLYRSEKNAFLPFLLASPVLFLLGAAFAHFVVVPMAMRFFLGYSDFPSMVSALFNNDGTPAGASDSGIKIVFQGKVNETLELTLKMIVAFGLCFQLPVLLTLMGKAGLASSRGLKATRKYAIVGILIIAGVVTPPDVLSQLLLFSVVYGLYEISIQLVAIVERGKDKAAREEGLIGAGESLFDDAEDEAQKS
jgi:sec-independent protein translocase protein TatC